LGIFVAPKSIFLERFIIITELNEHGHTENLDPLKNKFQQKASALAVETKAKLKEFGGMKVDEVTLKQVFGGMRGVKSMIWETSQFLPMMK